MWRVLVVMVPAPIWLCWAAGQVVRRLCASTEDCEVDGTRIIKPAWGLRRLPSHSHKVTGLGQAAGPTVRDPPVSNSLSLLSMSLFHPSLGNVF